MDQVKIGLFIRECRKAKGLTQEQLASKLYLTPKTISKWETGNGTPDVSIMHELCEALDISLNELFIGEHIKDEDDKSKINEQILLKVYADEKSKNKRLFVAAYVTGTIILSFFLVCTFVATFVPMPDYAKIILIVSSIVLIFIGAVVLSYLDIYSGYYECPHCHERFAPTLKEYLLSFHTFTKRKLTCPKCGETHWCRRKASKSETKEK